MKTFSEKKRKENVITQLYAVKNGYEKAIEEVFKAYPLDIFPDTTQAERDPIIEKYPGFIDRTSAMMGRHIAKVILERAMYFAREILEDGEAVEHTLAPDVAGVCRKVNHFYVEGVCANCGCVQPCHAGKA